MFLIGACCIFFLVGLWIGWRKAWKEAEFLRSLEV